jgi:hypothetical protein
MSLHHQRLLDTIARYEGAMGTRLLVAALRAVVELHAPSPGGEWAVRCLACPAPQPWPCSTVQAIARELEIEATDHG